jgi:hypothetical protein
MTISQPPGPEREPTEEERRLEAVARGRAIATTHFPEVFATKQRRAVWPALLGLAIMVAIAGALYVLLPLLARSSDAEVRDKIIKDSIAAYQADGRPCACPYNTTSDGTPCGDFSAYRRPGAAAPLCYPNDVIDAAVQEWRQRNRR